MTPEQTKLKRLLRLEKLRAIDKQAAASEAARAEDMLAQLQALATRASDLAADYATRRNVSDGGQLRQLAGFSAGLHGISATTQTDVERARAIADRRQSDLATAERRRAAVADRATEQARAIAAKAQYAAQDRTTTARRETGTAFE